MSMRKPKTINPDEVDPSVYYYDEVYDDMVDERDSGSSKRDDFGSVSKKESKYIQNIKESADARKAEKEFRKFKKIAQDRKDAEAEGQNGSEGVFITNAYKEKLESFKKMEEEKLKMLEKEQLNTLNFFNQNPHKQGTEAKSRDLDEDIGSSTSKETSQTEEQIDKPNEIKEGQDDSKTLEQRKKKKVPLKNIEDRRRFLREVLAKRTRGSVFKDAVRRYKLRKASRAAA